MLNFKARPMSSRLIWFGQVCTASIIVFGMLLIGPAQTVEANFFDTIKDIYHLPKNVENLQKQYEEARQSYEETKLQVEAQTQQLAEQGQKLTEQSQKLAEQSQQLMDSARKAEEREAQLNQQNQLLQEHNNDLQARLQVMEAAVTSKDRWIHRIKVISITIVSLVLLYFIIGRLFRVIIWQRNKKGAH